MQQRPVRGGVMKCSFLPVLSPLLALKAPRASPFDSIRSSLSEVAPQLSSPDVAHAEHSRQKADERPVIGASRLKSFAVVTSVEPRIFDNPDHLEITGLVCVLSRREDKSRLYSLQ